MNRSGSFGIGALYGIALTNILWLFDSAVRWGGSAAYGVMFWFLIAGITIVLFFIALHEDKKW